MNILTFSCMFIFISLFLPLPICSQPTPEPTSPQQQEVLNQSAQQEQAVQSQQAAKGSQPKQLTPSNAPMHEDPAAQGGDPAAQHPVQGEDSAQYAGDPAAQKQPASHDPAGDAQHTQTEEHAQTEQGESQGEGQEGQAGGEQSTEHPGIDAALQDEVNFFTKNVQAYATIKPGSYFDTKKRNEYAKLINTLNILTQRVAQPALKIAETDQQAQYYAHVKEQLHQHKKTIQDATLHYIENTPKAMANSVKKPLSDKQRLQYQKQIEGMKNLVEKMTLGERERKLLEELRQKEQEEQEKRRALEKQRQEEIAKRKQEAEQARERQRLEEQRKKEQEEREAREKQIILEQQQQEEQKRREQEEEQQRIALEIRQQEEEKIRKEKEEEQRKKQEEIERKIEKERQEEIEALLKAEKEQKEKRELEKIEREKRLEQEEQERLEQEKQARIKEEEQVRIKKEKKEKERKKQEARNIQEQEWQKKGVSLIKYINKAEEKKGSQPESISQARTKVLKGISLPLVASGGAYTTGLISEKTLGASIATTAAIAFPYTFYNWYLNQQYEKNLNWRVSLGSLQSEVNAGFSMANKLYFPSRKFLQPPKLMLNTQNYEFYLMPTDESLVPVFTSIVSTLKNNPNILYVAVRPTPGLTYTESQWPFSGHTLPRIIIATNIAGTDPNKLQAISIIEKIEPRVNTFVHLKNRPAFSKKIDKTNIYWSNASFMHNLDQYNKRSLWQKWMLSTQPEGELSLKDVQTKDIHMLSKENPSIN